MSQTTKYSRINQEIVKDAKKVEGLGASGIDLLACRYDRDPVDLIGSLQKAVKIPIIVAGSIYSFERVRKTLDLKVWAFTIESAFFYNKFVREGTFPKDLSRWLHDAFDLRDVERC